MLLAFFTVLTTQNFAQSGIPAGTCGIECIYDAAGNMIERQYVCNNTANPLFAAESFKTGTQERSYQAINTIYPNPTTGKFRIKLIKPVQNAKVEIVDAKGVVIARGIVNGISLEFDLSNKPAGIYFVKIYEQGTILSVQVVKQ